MLFIPNNSPLSEWADVLLSLTIFFLGMIFFYSHKRHIMTLGPSLIFSLTSVNFGVKFVTLTNRNSFSCNTPLDVQHHIASLTNMPIVFDLGMYLGVPLILKRKTTSAFQPLLDEIQTRIRAWQSKIISQAGRVTLIKSVLSPTPLTIPCKRRFFLEVFLTTSINRYGAFYGVTWLLKSIYIS